MSDPVQAAVWVSGDRFNVDYLIDTDRGEVLRKVVHQERGGTTGGMGRQCGREFVAVYVAPDGEGVVLQVGERRIDLDDGSRAIHTRRLGGAISQLTVTRPGEPDLSVRQWNGGGAFLRRVDPAYDDLDDLSDDFLRDVANIVNSPERRTWLLEIKDPAEGPWDA